MLALLKESPMQCPQAKVGIQIEGQGPVQVDLRLPVFTNKFAEPLDITQEEYHRTWDEITHSKPHFEKVDCILKNPAPPNISHMEVLKKMANFFQNSLNLKVFPPANTSDFWQVKAAGTVNFKPASQTNFPSNPSEMHPPVTATLLIESEFFPEDTTEFKVSVRAGEGKPVAASVLNLLKFYIQP